MTNKIAVLGAGMVGVSCALELQRRGFDVTLVDRAEIGSQTSYGNAGMITRSSIFPINNPGLWKNLPKLVFNTSTSFRYDPFFLAKNIKWASKFLFNALNARCFETIAALNGLINLSIQGHRVNARAAGLDHMLHEDGWYFLYRNSKTYQNANLGRDVFEQYGVKTEVLSRERLGELEPCLQPVFQKGLWVKDGMSVNNPQTLVRGYANLFIAQSGRFVQSEIEAIEDKPDGTSVSFASGEKENFERVVICMGPWAKNFLELQGYRIGMAYERGYHQRFSPKKNVNLNRPFYDVDGGYVMAPMENGLQVSTGVELADLEAQHQYVQLHQAVSAARQAIDLDDEIESMPWMGARPTFPDSRPVIGHLPENPNIWFAFGHQHIGLSTGPGTARILGALMSGEEPEIDATVFAPQRFVQDVKGQ